MARPLRIEFAGALYHLTARGDRREAIYDDDRDRESFLDVLGKKKGSDPFFNPSFSRSPIVVRPRLPALASSTPSAVARRDAPSSSGAARHRGFPKRKRLAKCRVMHAASSSSLRLTGTTRAPAARGISNSVHTARTAGAGISPRLSLSDQAPANSVTIQSAETMCSGQVANHPVTLAVGRSGMTNATATLIWRQTMCGNRPPATDGYT